MPPAAGDGCLAGRRARRAPAPRRRPPDAAARRRRRPPLKEYIRHLIFERLPQGGRGRGRGAGGGGGGRGASGARGRCSARARRAGRGGGCPGRAARLLNRPSARPPHIKLQNRRQKPPRPPGSVLDVLRQLLKLPWDECERYVLKCMLKARGCRGGGRGVPRVPGGVLQGA